MAPWGPDVEAIFTSAAHGDFDRDDERTMRDADFSEEQLRELFDDGFLTRSDDRDVTPDDRYDAREAFFDWLEYMGYDRDDFDWEAWREYMGYE